MDLDSHHGSTTELFEQRNKGLVDGVAEPNEFPVSSRESRTKLTSLLHDEDNQLLYVTGTL